MTIRRKGCYYLRMSNIPPVQDPRNVIPPLGQETSTLPERGRNQALSSLSSQSEFSPLELYAKYALAFTLGIFPFVISSSGKSLLKGVTYFVLQCDRCLLTKPLRILLSLPALLSGSTCFGGAFLFSVTQQFVWGRELVFHPLEEAPNTILARYGGSFAALEDFSLLFSGFLLFSNESLQTLLDFQPS